MTKATVIPREYDGTRQDGELFRGAVNIAETICRLPAIPTTDWCDRAAAALGAVHPSSALVLLIAALDPGSSRIGGVTACGVAVRSGGREHEILAAELRQRLDRLVGSDWMPSPRADGGSSASGDFFPTRQAVSPAHADLWRQLAWPDVLATLAPIESTPRVAIAYLAPLQGGGGMTRAQSGVLGAALALLARRSATMPWPTRPGGWISPSEQQVLERLVLGKSVREVAEELERSPHTVHDHVKSLHRKLKASTRGELVAKALGHTPTRAPAATPTPANVPVAG